MLLQRPRRRRRTLLPKNVMQQERKVAEAAAWPKKSQTSTSQGAHLTPLKTLSELRTSDELVEALVVQIPEKLASTVLRLIQPLFPTTAITRSFTHLRRFASLRYLPTKLRALYDDTPKSKGTIYLILPPPLPISPEISIPVILEPYLDGHAVEVERTFVPADPPISLPQANEWSERYWPCVFNPAAQPLQNAPPLQTLRSVIEELERKNAEQVKRFMSLAQEVAKEAWHTGEGREIGAVIVNSVINEVIVVAGDRRWAKSGRHEQDQLGRQDEGRPENHSLMRAIAFVAERERQRRIGCSSETADFEQFERLTSLERSFFHADKLSAPAAPDPTNSADSAKGGPERPGYLCHGLDLYITHEPCVCCSMALIHSRFRVCVFKKRMLGTGGLCAEQNDGGLGYGMFWRRELNWRTLTFQLAKESLVQSNSGDNEVREHKYHA